jgi:hypothetical protein
MTPGEECGGAAKSCDGGSGSSAGDGLAVLHNIGTSAPLAADMLRKSKVRASPGKRDDHGFSRKEGLKYASPEADAPPPLPRP